jgi:hypothetical protein
MTYGEGECVQPGIPCESLVCASSILVQSMWNGSCVYHTHKLNDMNHNFCLSLPVTHLVTGMLQNVCANLQARTSRQE